MKSWDEKGDRSLMLPSVAIFGTTKEPGEDAQNHLTQLSHIKYTCTENIRRKQFLKDQSNLTEPFKCQLQCSINRESMEIPFIAAYLWKLLAEIFGNGRGNHTVVGVPAKWKLHLRRNEISMESTEFPSCVCIKGHWIFLSNSKQHFNMQL